MAASALSLDPLGDPDEGPRRGRRKPLNLGAILAVAAVALAAVLALTLLRGESVSERRSDMKTTRVILPPPPPPPPPEPKPQDKPPEPKPTPVEQPTNAPPPPTPQAEPAPGDSALSAREGAGPSNYGLAVGDGGGTRIGGKTGSGDAFAAYANVALAGVRQAAQGDRELSRGRYTVALAVQVSPDGRITAVRLINPTGDARRDARLIAALTGLQLSQRPPAGLPTMRIELNARSGA